MKRARFCLILAIALVLVLGFGSTALATNEPWFSLDAHKDDCELIKEYGWTVNKLAEPLSMTLKKGESQVVQYTIVLDRDAGTNMINVKAKCKISVHNGPIKFEYAKAKLTFNGSDVPGTEKSLTLPDGGEFSGTKWVNYEVYCPSSGGGTYRVVFEVKEEEGDTKTDATHSYDFNYPPHERNKHVSVTDKQTPSLPAGFSFANSVGYAEHWSANGDKTVEYQVTITNDSNTSGGSGTFDNTVSIDGTDVSDTISVSVKAPGSSNPEPREERKVRWPDRTPPPEEVAPTAELPKTGGLIEWEWIALAGGMLTSCGGGLYLWRRRRNRK